MLFACAQGHFRLELSMHVSVLYFRTANSKMTQYVDFHTHIIYFVFSWQAISISHHSITYSVKPYLWLILSWQGRPSLLGLARMDESEKMRMEKWLTASTQTGLAVFSHGHATAASYGTVGCSLVWFWSVKWIPGSQYKARSLAKLKGWGKLIEICVKDWRKTPIVKRWKTTEFTDELICL